MTDGNVYQRMVKAAEIIGSQQWVKDMANNQFKSIPIDAMRNGVRAACVKVGLVHIGPVDIEYNLSRSDERTTKIMGTCKFIYVNADNPDESIEYESMGEAMDNGDKCVGKFITNLIKNHYKSAFDIGEQGKDDIDSYSNEEYYEADARIKAKASRQTEPDVDPFFKTPAKAQAPKTAPAKPKTSAPAMDPEKAKLVDKLTDMVMAGGSNRDIIFTILGDRKLQDLDIEELRNIMDNVDPFGVGQ